MIQDIRSTSVKNSAGKRSVKISLKSNGKYYYASIPGGSSRGKHEVKDADPTKVSSILNKITPKLLSKKEDYEKVDDILRSIDKTKDLHNIGGNVALGISIATARAQTKNRLWELNGQKKKFPFPLVNVIGGGQHGGNTDFQEFLILPHKEKSFPAALRRARGIWQYIGTELKKRKLLIRKNLENAWITKMNDIDTLDFIESLEIPDVKLGIDFAASSLWNGKQYIYKKSKMALRREEHFDFVSSIIDDYEIFFAEDAFHEEDFHAFANLRRRQRRSLVVGDDLTTTNPIRLDRAIKKKSINAIIVKPNQIGLLSSAQQVTNVSKNSGILPVTSHRSQETMDDWLADLSIAWRVPIIKSGIAGFDAPKLLRLSALWRKIPDARMSRIS